MNKRVRRYRPVVVQCTSCGWEQSGSTWRPMRRALREHVLLTHHERVR